jgi:site-specific DNA recombinase
MKSSLQHTVVLARVSTREQEVEGYSLPAQQKLLAEYCERKDFSRIKEFTISETASKTKQRKVFQEMMAYIEQNNIKLLVVEKVDRLVRNFKDTVMIDDWLEMDESRQVHFVKDSLILHKNARSQEKLNWGMRVVIAKNFIDNLKEEVKKGQDEKIAQGLLPHKSKIGYRTVELNGKKIQEPDPEMAPLVRKAFERYLDPSHSTRTLLSEMNAMGLRTRTGKPLVLSHLNSLLKNVFYIGKIPWNGQVYPGAHEPLISEELFDAVQRKISGGKPPVYSKHNSLFRGMLECEECQGRITWERQKGRWYGRCNGYHGCSKKQYAREDEIEHQLMEVFSNIPSPSPAIMEWVRSELKNRHSTDMEAHYASMHQLKRRHEDITRRIDLAYDDRLDGRLSAEKYDAKVLEFTTEQEAISKKLQGYDEAYVAQLEYNLDIVALTQRAAEIYQAKTEPEQRRQLLVEIFSNLTLNGKILTYEYTEAAVSAFKLAKEVKDLENKFEPSEKGSPKQEEALSVSIRPIWQGWPGSNRRHPVLETGALPTELHPYDWYWLSLSQNVASA